VSKALFFCSFNRTRLFMSQKQSPIPTYGFLRLPQILAVFPVSKSAWWEGCRTGRYPKPVELGPRTTAWKAEDSRP
jgi:predicted DNA-binding transcriptional regulator AlpA